MLYTRGRRMYRERLRLLEACWQVGFIYLWHRSEMAMAIYGGGHYQSTLLQCSTRFCILARLTVEVKLLDCLYVYLTKFSEKATCILYLGK